jgi:hypothetical protein
MWCAGTRNQDCRCEDRRRPKLPTQDVDLASVSGGADFKTGIVEEVLGAEDDGYRAIGYIVQSQRARTYPCRPIRVPSMRF